MWGNNVEQEMAAVHGLERTPLQSSQLYDKELAELLRGRPQASDLRSPSRYTAFSPPLSESRRFMCSLPSRQVGRAMEK